MRDLRLLIAIALGLGLTLALLWMLPGPSGPALAHQHDPAVITGSLHAIERVPTQPTSPVRINALNPNPPGKTVKLVFIHHSVGNNWLDDGNGDLGAALGDNNYYLSDTYYDWGPDDLDAGYGTIGDHTDIGRWYYWFAGPHSDIYLSALYSTTNQNATYTRPMADPGGENKVIMFKSCYPNSHIGGNPDDPPNDDPDPPRGFPSSHSDHNVANIKRIYIDILEYFETRQEKLFIVITAPPRLAANTDAAHAANARAVNNWLVHEWLADYPYRNVAVFDFYNVLTTNGGDDDTNDYGLPTGNHHRLVTTTIPITIEHITDGDDDASPNVLEYPSWGTNEHPNPAGNQKATGEFIPLLNVYYNCWKYGHCWGSVADWISVTAVNGVASVYPGETATFTLSVTASAGFTTPVTFSLQGEPAGTTVSYDPNPVTPPGTSQLYVTTTVSTIAGTYAMTVTGTSGVLTDTVDLTLIVASATPSFTLSISPTTRIAEPGQEISYTVVVTGIDGFSQPVSLTVVELPTSVGAAWSVNPVTPDNSSILTLSIPGSLPLGHYPFYVVGTAGTQVVAKDIELIIPFRIYLPIVLK